MAFGSSSPMLTGAEGTEEVTRAADPFGNRELVERARNPTAEAEAEADEYFRRRREAKFMGSGQSKEIARGFAQESGYIPAGDEEELSLAQILERRARERQQGAIERQIGVGSEAARLRARVGERLPPQIDITQQQQFRGGQQELADILAARARGEAPSAAEMQFERSQEALLRGAQAQAASARGVGSAALQQRQLSRATSQIGLEGAQQAAVIRQQEQQQAEQALGALLGQARQQDIGLAAQQTQFELEAERIRDQLIQGLLETELGAAEAERLANQFISSLTANFLTGNAQAAAAQSQARAQVTGAAIGAAGQVLGSLVGGG